MLYVITVFRYPSLPTVAETLPPSASSVDFVTMLIVPPTDGIGNLAEPRPL